MLFSGLSDLFGHRGGGMFGGSQGFMDQPENVTINNYGDHDGDGGNDDDDRSGDDS